MCGRNLIFMKNSNKSKLLERPKNSKLTLINEKVKKIGRNWLSEYKCDCGKIKLIRKGHVDSGSTKSCGCSTQELRRPLIIKHGLWANNKKLFTIWQTMRRKCYDKKHHNFKNYGSRGIKVCKKWLKSFKIFHEWSIKNGYVVDTKLQLDRRNNDGDYKPSNCRWTTAKVNSNNRRSSLKVEKVKKIKYLLSKGLSSYKISEMTDTPASSIRGIKQGRTHSDVIIDR